jgi:DNA repair protein RecO (recombination protein O)
MIQWTTEAIVLSADAQGESDLRALSLTRKQGRLAAVAKGALRSRKRFIGVFDPGQVIEAGFMIAPRSGRVMIEHAVAREQFPRFRESPLRLARACLLLETALLLAPESAPAPELFDNLRRGLFRLHDEPDSDRWALVYAFRMISALGYRPGLDCCVRCLAGTLGTKTVFSPAAGGVLCASCCEHEQAIDSSGTGAAVLELSPDASRTLTEVMKVPEARLSRISFTRNALGQAREVLNLFIAHHLPRPSRALPFMESLEKRLIAASR